jgi:hypothetical protein
MNHDSYSTAAWYTQIPASDRQTVDAVAKWLAPVPWQLFATFTFTWDVRRQQLTLTSAGSSTIWSEHFVAMSASSPARNGSFVQLGLR